MADTLKERLRKLQAQGTITQISSKASQSDEDVCPICEGMLVVKKNVPIGHPDFGKAFPCECQKGVLNTKHFNQLVQKSNLTAYDDMRFDNFRQNLDWLNSEQNAMLEYAFTEAMSFAREPANSWLVFTGNYGSGKTHLAAAIGNYCLDHHHQVVFMTVPDLLDHIRNTYAPDAKMGFDDLFNQLKNTPLLILDDLGSESPTEWANEKLFQLLNHRYVNQYPTVVTTNVDTKAIDDRLQSRLADQYLVRNINLNLPDYRRGEVSQSWSELANFSLYSQFSFENFEPRQNLGKEIADNLEQAYMRAREFAINPQGWLMLLGDSGCGKTHLAAAIANFRLNQGDEVVMVSIADLLDYLRAAFNPSSGSSLDKRFDEIRKVPLLVLDHFQLKTATPWAQEKLFQIIDYRYLAKLPTVFTKHGTNLDGLDDLFKSRFGDPRISQMFLIKAPSYRGGVSAQR